MNITKTTCRVLLLLTFTTLQLSAQNNLDSLKSVLNDSNAFSTLQDTNHHQLIVQIATIHSNNFEMDSAHYYLDKLISIEKELTQKTKIKIYKAKVSISYRTRDYEEALIYLEKILNIKDSSIKKGSIYQNTASLYMEQGQLNKALQFAQRAHEIFRHDNDNKSIVKILNNIGNCLLYTSDAADE